MNYLEYLRSPEWRTVKDIKLWEQDFTCCDCSSRIGLQGHHNTYPNPIESTSIKDIFMLCPECHRDAHRGTQSTRIPIEISPAIAIDYVQSSSSYSKLRRVAIQDALGSLFVSEFRNICPTGSEAFDECLKQFYKKHDLEIIERGWSPGHGFININEGNAVMKVFQSMQRKEIMRLFIEGLSKAEIKSNLGCADGTIKRTIEVYSPFIEDINKIIKGGKYE